jgi:hypothetical protein
MKTMLLSVESAQVALFASSINLLERLKTAEIIKNQFSSVFDGTPTILPIPDDAPQEIPRIILNTKLSNYTCQVAANRVDLIYKAQSKEDFDSYASFFKAFSEKIKLLNKVIVNTLQTNVYRLGIIVNYAGYPKTDSVTYLRDSFLSRTTKTEKELQIHMRFEDVLAGYKVNNWLRIITREPKSGSSLLIISDINTTQKEKYDVKLKDANDYFDVAFKTSIITVDEVLNI